MASSLLDAKRSVIGMVHLPPLPGSPGYDGTFEAVREAALRDARVLEEGGIDAVLVENFGDAPFYPDDVPKHVVASMTAVTAEIVHSVDLPVGVNVLRNDAEAALAVAAAAGASFVRANVHVGVRATDQGIVGGRAHETVRLRDHLGADVAILADLDVKHSAPIGEYDPSIEEVVERGRADGVLVSGRATGESVPLEHLSATVERRDERELDVPVFVGSGVTPATAPALLEVADGLIVGTALKEGGETTNPVDSRAVQELVEAVRG